MAPTTQKALLVPSKGAPWEIRTDRAVPSPGPGEVLVEVHAAALNPADWAVQALGLAFITEYPWVGGCDGAGVVEDLGPEVTGFEKGDKILFPRGSTNNSDTATFQEYCVVIAENAAKIPDIISFDQAATIPLALVTGLSCLWSHHPDASTLDFPAPWEEGGATKYAGKPAFIAGGSTSVGQYVIQAACLNGFSPIITTASLTHEAFLKSLGATHVLDRALPDDTILSEIPNLTGGEPVVFAFEAVGRSWSQRLAYAALGKNGGYVSVVPGGDPDIADLIKPDDGKRIRRPVGSFRAPANHALGIELYKRLSGWLANGTLVPNRVEVLSGGLSQVPDALQRFPANKVSGIKLIVRPQETS